jgi:hypothetical protein
MLYTTIEYFDYHCDGSRDIHRYQETPTGVSFAGVKDLIDYVERDLQLLSHKVGVRQENSRRELCEPVDFRRKWYYHRFGAEHHLCRLECYDIEDEVFSDSDGGYWMEIQNLPKVRIIHEVVDRPPWWVVSPPMPKTLKRFVMETPVSNPLNRNYVGHY